jgi:hypothetical protein
MLRAELRVGISSLTRLVVAFGALRAASGVAALLACAVLGTAWSTAHAQEGGVSASSAIYVRSDTDHTTVITPRVRVGAPLSEETRLDLVYTVDVWSSASIDIVTAATRRVIEQRDEIDVSIEHAFPDITLAVVGRAIHG